MAPPPGDYQVNAGGRGGGPSSRSRSASTDSTVGRRRCAGLSWRSGGSMSMSPARTRSRAGRRSATRRRSRCLPRQCKISRIPLIRYDASLGSTPRSLQQRRSIQIFGDMAGPGLPLLNRPNDEITWFLLQRFLEERTAEFTHAYREDLGPGRPAGATQALASPPARSSGIAGGFRANRACAHTPEEEAEPECGSQR